jgi:hypothetical protein
LTALSRLATVALEAKKTALVHVRDKLKRLQNLDLTRCHISDLSLPVAYWESGYTPRPMSRFCNRLKFDGLPLSHKLAAG